MTVPYQPKEGLPTGEIVANILASASLIVDTPGRRFHVEWDPDAPVTPLGQLVFFSQFLGTSGLFRDWVAECPLQFTSPNAPTKTDLLGTITLAILSGQWRYRHITALRGDRVNPAGLGMSKVCGEDSVRRAFQDQDAAALAKWQRKHLLASVAPALVHPWILDIDVTIKTIYGHQEGAEVGYNPHKPGRPSHNYHSYFLAGLRLTLDVEVHAGKEHAAKHGLPGLWQLIDGLSAEQRPYLIRGDCQYGQEHLMSDAEPRQQKYLFRLRQTPKVKYLIRLLETKGDWKGLSQGWEAKESTLRLSGWSCKRRVVILRRALKNPTAESTQPALPWSTPEVLAGQEYEYLVLITNLTWELLSLWDCYRQRADCENVYDELKNQWGWGGFTTKDQLRCQVAARNVALIYNWWSLLVRLADPQRPREAITSRPLLLTAVGRLIEHGGRKVLRLTSSHAEAKQAQSLLTTLSLFLSGLHNTAPQLSPKQCFERIWERILQPLLKPVAALPVPAG